MIAPARFVALIEDDPLLRVPVAKALEAAGYQVASAANGSPIALEALQRNGALYGVEDDVRGQPPDERCRTRQASAGPLLDQLRMWLDATCRSCRASPSSLGQSLCPHALAGSAALSRWRPA